MCPVFFFQMNHLTTYKTIKLTSKLFKHIIRKTYGAVLKKGKVNGTPIHKT